MLLQNNRLKGLILTSAVLILVVGATAIFSYTSPMRKHSRAGDKAVAAGDYQLAEENYQLGLDVSPDNWDLQVKMARVYLAEQKFLPASQLLSALLEKQPNRKKNLAPLLAEAQLGMAKQAKETDSNRKLIKVFLENAYKYAPEEPEIRQMLAEAIFYDALELSYSGRDAQDNSWSDKMTEAIALDPKPVYKAEMAKRFAELQMSDDFEKVLASLSSSELADEEAQFVLARAFMTILGMNQGQELERTLGLINRGISLMPENLVLLIEKMRLIWTKDMEGAKELVNTPGLNEKDRELLDNYAHGLEASIIKEKNTYKQDITGDNIRVFAAEKGSIVTWVETTGEGSQSDVHGQRLIREQRLMGLDLATGKTSELLRTKGQICSYLITRDKNIIYSLWSSQTGLPNPEGEGKATLMLQKPGGIRSKLSDLRNAFPGFFPDKLSPDGKYLLVSDENDTLIDLTDKSKHRVVLPSGYRVISWTLDSKNLLVMDSSLQAGKPGYKILNLKGEQLRELPSGP
ncbi:MAG TPA: tetratricopeptide repeat protein, partial [Verrucomicrobiae bacterium]|nr:tetratricopeptide repeat protein [Verrucomicrobiae bacterium]